MAEWREFLTFRRIPELCANYVYVLLSKFHPLEEKSASSRQLSEIFCNPPYFNSMTSGNLRTRGWGQTVLHKGYDAKELKDSFNRSLSLARLNQEASATEHTAKGVDRTTKDKRWRDSRTTVAWKKPKELLTFRGNLPQASCSTLNQLNYTK